MMFPRYYVVTGRSEEGTLYGAKDSWTQLGPRSLSTNRLEGYIDAKRAERYARKFEPHDCFKHTHEEHVMGCRVIDCAVCGILIGVSSAEYDPSKEVMHCVQCNNPGEVDKHGVCGNCFYYNSTHKDVEPTTSDRETKSGGYLI